MSITIKRTGAADYGRFIKALICGDPGAGKTLISSTFPNPLFASAEGGLMSLASRNIPYVEIKGSTDLLAVKHAVDQAPEVRKELLGFPVDTVVIDTIDEVQKILIRERLEENKKDSMQLQDWGWLGEQMQAIIRGFRNLDLNVVFTCHLKESSDAESGRVWFEPGLQGAIGKSIPGYVDLALLLKSNTVTKVIDGEAQKVFVRSLITRPDTQHSWIKDRSGQLPAEIEVNFTDDYARVATLIYGSIDLPATATVTVDEMPAEKVQEPTPEPEPIAPQTQPEDLVMQPTPLPDASSSNPPAQETTVVDPPAPAPEPVQEKPARVCAECNAEVNEDQADLSRIRFRTVLCREHFMDRKKR